MRVVEIVMGALMVLVCMLLFLGSFNYLASFVHLSSISVLEHMAQNN